MQWLLAGEVVGQAEAAGQSVAPELSRGVAEVGCDQLVALILGKVARGRHVSQGRVFLRAGRARRHATGRDHGSVDCRRRDQGAPLGCASVGNGVARTEDDSVVVETGTLVEQKRGQGNRITQQAVVGVRARANPGVPLHAEGRVVQCIGAERVGHIEHESLGPAVALGHDE